MPLVRKALAPLPHLTQEPAQVWPSPPPGCAYLKGRHRQDHRTASRQAATSVWIRREWRPLVFRELSDAAAGQGAGTPRDLSSRGHATLCTPSRRATRWRPSILLGTPQSQADGDWGAGLRTHFWHSWIASFSLFQMAPGSLESSRGRLEVHFYRILPHS